MRAADAKAAKDVTSLEGQKVAAQKVVSRKVWLKVSYLNLILLL